MATVGEVAAVSVLARLYAPVDRRALEIGNRPLTAASLADLFGGGQTATGKRISEASALNVSTVLACTRVLSETVASFPLHLYRRLDPRGKARATDHPVYRVLHRQPNRQMNRYTFWQTLMGHLCLWGNAFAEIERDGNGTVMALWPLRPDRMEPPTAAASGDLLYPYSLPNGERRQLAAANVLHLRGLSGDGRWGYSLITLQRESLGLALTAEEFGSRFFSNMARPGGVLTSKGRLSEEAATRLKASWEASHRGLDNAHRVAVLEEGLEWQSVGIPPQDAQWLELRKYQRSEIAGWFRIPPHLIGDLDRSTNNNIEQQALEFVEYTLRPWLVNIEQQITTTLLTESEQETYFAEFLLDALLRGDSQARGAFYSTLFNIGALSPNDIREYENLNPVPGGDKHWIGLNLAPLDQAAQGQAPGGQDQQAQDEQPSEADTELLIARLLLNIQRLEELGLQEEAQKARERLAQLVEQQSQAGERAVVTFDPDMLDDDYEQRDGLGAELVLRDDLEPAEVRSLGGRLRLREVYRATYLELMEPLVERQAAAIEEQAGRLLRQRDLADFSAWLERYHRDELAPVLQRDALPIVAAYTAAMDRAILAELELPRFVDEADPFVQRYAEAFAAHYADNSAGTLAVLARDANQKGLSALDAVQQRLVEWLATRANRVADNEAVRNGEAAARNAYRRGGVQRLKWRTSGRNCPFCSRLDGRTVGIQDVFIPTGTELEGNEGEPKLRVKRDTRHPPVHRRCNCAVVKA